MACVCARASDILCTKRESEQERAREADRARVRARERERDAEPAPFEQKWLGENQEAS